jgi:hypothetical protein
MLDGPRLYYWCGVGACIVGVLLLILLFAGHIVTDQRDVPAWIGGYCAILATALSIFQILEHLAHFAVPECQSKVVRILFMVPLYAVFSWISILAPGASEYLDLVRDGYEAYALYNFFALMMEQMGGVDHLYRELMAEERPPVPHCWPMHHCFEPMRITPTFVRRCRLSLAQFMVLKPLLALVIIMLTATDMYGKLFDLGKGHFWTFMIYNTTYSIALIALWYFYFGMKPFLEGKNALSKFWCIKSVVFLTYWQGMVIEVVAATLGLPRFDYWSEERAASGLQNLLVCIEMLFVAFAHKFCFPADEFTSPDGAGATDMPDFIEMVPARRSKMANLRLTMQHEDIRRDLKDTAYNR